MSRLRDARAHCLALLLALLLAACGGGGEQPPDDGRASISPPVCKGDPRLCT